MEDVIILALCMMCVSCVIVALGVVGWVWFSSSDTTDSSSSSTSTSTSSSGTGDWKDAYSTYYESYPACCKSSPNYDAKASKSECSDFSACQYLGKFTSLKDPLPFEEVKSRNIVAYFDDSQQRNVKSVADQTWWRANVNGKKIEIRNPATGKTLLADALDTCGNYDCKKEGKYGCCTTNALKGGGILIDMEVNTAKRFWGKPKNGKIQWRWT